MFSVSPKRAQLKDFEEFFKKLYFGGDLKETISTQDRVNLLFQMAREYRELLCHENELQNKRKTIFWTTQTMLCGAYYYIGAREEIPASPFIWVAESILMIFLCIWGIISTIRFLRAMYYGARANRFLHFRWQAFVELYCSCVLSEEGDEINEEARVYADIPTSLTPFLPPVIGLADPRESLCVDLKETGQESNEDEKVILDCSSRLCVEILAQIVDNKKTVENENTWYFDCEPGMLKNFYRSKMHKYYDKLLLGWWILLSLWPVINMTRHIVAYSNGPALPAALAVTGGGYLIYNAGVRKGRVSRSKTES